MNSEERKRMLQILEARLDDPRNYTKETIKANEAKLKEVEIDIDISKQKYDALSREVESMMANEAGLQTEILELEDSAVALIQRELEIEIKLANMPIRGGIDLVGRRNNTMEATLEDVRLRELIPVIKALEAERTEIRARKEAERKRLIEIRNSLYERRQIEDDMAVIEARISLAKERYEDLLDKTNPDTFPLDLVNDEVSRERFLSDVLKLDGQRGVDSWSDRIDAARENNQPLLIYPPTMGPFEYTTVQTRSTVETPTPEVTPEPTVEPVVEESVVSDDSEFVFPPMVEDVDPTETLSEEASKQEPPVLTEEMQRDIERALANRKRGPVFYDQEAEAAKEKAAQEDKPVRNAAVVIKENTNEEADLEEGIIEDTTPEQQASTWQKIKGTKWFKAIAFGVVPLLLTTCIATNLVKNFKDSENTSRVVPKEAPFDPSQSQGDVGPAIDEKAAEEALTDAPSSEKAPSQGRSSQSGGTSNNNSGHTNGGQTNSGNTGTKPETKKPIVIDEGDKTPVPDPVDPTPPPYVPTPIPEPELPPTPVTPAPPQSQPDPQPETPYVPTPIPDPVGPTLDMDVPPVLEGIVEPQGMSR